MALMSHINKRTHTQGGSNMSSNSKDRDVKVGIVGCGGIANG